MATGSSVRKRLIGTYRVTLTHEESGAVAFERGGISASVVEQLAQLLMQIAPLAIAARGAQQAWQGMQGALTGLAQLQGGSSATRRTRR
ncbi:MAG: hypothetical protein JO086_00180 [Acidimicrobiia bacterium]|nr:hypothetical protein [Acidimicrobiia bacterium]